MWVAIGVVVVVVEEAVMLRDAGGRGGCSAIDGGQECRWLRW